MKNGVKMRTGWLAPFCLAGLLACGGCESDTDEDRSGADAFFRANPYQGEERESEQPMDLQLSPAQATAGAVGQTVVFTASGGGGAFRWRVGDSSAGAIEARGANQALYTCLLVGNNSVIVEDGEGHYAAARIVPVADALAVSPASAALSGGAVDVSFAVSGGSPPYVWTSGNPRLGTVSYSEDSSYVAAYRAVAGVYGVNVVTVIDQEGRTLSVTVTQSP